MIDRYKSQIAAQLRQIPGWRTHRKIIVIESDDWGTIRMPSKEVYGTLLRDGIRVNECPYNRVDALESEEDLSHLFDLLTQIEDTHGKAPVITANVLTSNPDFEKIKASGFEQYTYELLTETYKKYPKHSNSFTVLKQGMENNLFLPQFHGREHLNVARWMRGLRSNFPETRKTFDLNLFGISTSISSENRKSYMQAFGFDDPSEITSHRQIIREGLELFEKLFGFRSESFIAPSYTWHADLDPLLSEMGIRYIQGKGYRKQPTSGVNKVDRFHMGARNGLNQIYLRRNCFFEPSYYKKDWVSSCLNEISNAFFWHKPAIIQSHRLNFIGFIDTSNRDQNLNMLKDLLLRVTKRWPEIEFLSSVQLGQLIR